jgi:hypothetical protein
MWPTEEQGRRTAWREAWIAALLLMIAGAAHAQTDEIQVYDGAIVRSGGFNLTWHNNYVASGHREPDFPGALVAEHSLNGVLEWAYGVAPWFEAGLYLPLYSVSQHGSLTGNGAKLRALFVVPEAAARHFFYGVNFEFSVNAAHWDADRYTQEIRLILGWHLGRIDIVFNPILDNSWHGFSELVFAPATRVALNLEKHWAIALEEYADLGPLKGFLPGSRQSHQLFAVIDHEGARWSVEGGVGFGLTRAADALVLKLILSRNLN